MNKDTKISSNQIKGLLVTSILGVGVLSLPNNLGVIMGLDGWIPIIVAGILMVGMTLVIFKIFDYFPEKDIFEISKATLGTIISTIYQIILLFYMVILLAYVSRTLGEVIRAFLLEKTPIEVIIITFILVTSYISRCEIDVIGRMGFFIYPLILGFIVFLALVTLPNAKFENLLPMFQSDIKTLPTGLLASIISYGGFEILLFAIPYTEDKDKVFKSSLSAIGIITVIYLAIFIMATSQFGIDQLQRLPWPTLSLVKEIDLPGLFLENLDGVVTTMWVLVVFGTLSATYFSSAKILANLFKTKSHELFILPLLPIIYTISLIPQNSIELQKGMTKLLTYLAIVTIFIFPMIISIISHFKSRRYNN